MDTSETIAGKRGRAPVEEAMDSDTPARSLAGNAGRAIFAWPLLRIRE